MFGVHVIMRLYETLVTACTIHHADRPNVGQRERVLPGLRARRGAAQGGAVSSPPVALVDDLGEGRKHSNHSTHTECKSSAALSPVAFINSGIRGDEL
jgi:hypothetical protein